VKLCPAGQHLLSSLCWFDDSKGIRSVKKHLPKYTQMKDLDAVCRGGQETRQVVRCTGPCRLENWDQGGPSNPCMHEKADVKMMMIITIMMIYFFSLQLDIFLTHTFLYVQSEGHVPW